jgi:two-component system sensor histidine kinase TctE
MRTTLLLWLLIPLIALSTVSTFLAFLFAERFTNDSYDTFLENSADSIVARLERDQKGVIIADLPAAAQAVLRHHGIDKFYYQIVDSRGNRIAGDSVLPLPIGTDRSAAHFRNAVVEGNHVRMCRISVVPDEKTQPLWIQVAETLNARQRLLFKILLSIVVPQLALVALGCVAVWYGVQNGLSSLTKLSQLLRRRSRLDLSPVEIGNTPAELVPVTSALNEMFNYANSHMHSQQEFIGNAAHQLRTPMTALKTYIDYLKRVNDSPAVTGVLHQIEQVTNRLVHMTNRLLVLARAEGKTDRPIQTVDLSAVIDDAAANVVAIAISKGVEMHFDIPGSPLGVFADAHELCELVTNLLENAIHYTGEGNGVWITVSGEEDITLTVADEGPGIPEEEKSKVFERFYRASNAGNSGCGLGLSIVREIALKYGASVDVRDRAPHGASFSVRFPREKPDLLGED